MAGRHPAARLGSCRALPCDQGDVPSHDRVVLAVASLSFRDAMDGGPDGPYRAHPVAGRAGLCRESSPTMTGVLGGDR